MYPKLDASALCPTYALTFWIIVCAFDIYDELPHPPLQ